MNGRLAASGMRGGVVAGVLFVAVLGGCSGHYKVTDPASGRVYYTRDVDGVRGGAVEFKDETTGANVTLQSSEVKEIKSEEFDAAVKKK